MKTLKNWLLALFLGCFLCGGPELGLNPQAGGVDTGNPKGQPSLDPTKPIYFKGTPEKPLKQIPGEAPISQGPGELGPKIMKV